MRNRISSRRAGSWPTRYGLHRAEDGFGGFPAAAHFAQPDQAVVGLHFDDRAHKAAPMAAIGVAQGRFQRDGDRGRPDIPDLHV